MEFHLVASCPYCDRTENAPMPIAIIGCIIHSVASLTELDQLHVLRIHGIQVITAISAPFDDALRWAPIHAIRRRTRKDPRLVSCEIGGDRRGGEVYYGSGRSTVHTVTRMTETEQQTAGGYSTLRAARLDRVIAIRVPHSGD